jgi:hypothetical protein
MVEIEKKWSSVYRKNIDDLRALVLGIYPSFIYRRVDRLPQYEIPVFVFHSADHRLLDAQLKFLSANGYQTLSADGFTDLLGGQPCATPKPVLLTFDDGISSVWTKAYPLLKHYGQRAVCFIVPRWIEDGKRPRPNLEDHWHGESALEAIQQLERKPPLCTWKEIEIMHRSGVIDFHSHSLAHASIFTDPRIIDFVRPGMQPSFLTSNFQPILRTDEGDRVPGTLPLGQPIYPWRSQFSEHPRYLEDPRLSEACTRYVAENGGPAFFAAAGWRRRLRQYANDFQQTVGSGGRFETPMERIDGMIRDLAASRACIEQRLDKAVRHLCHPWYIAGPTAVAAAREAGFRATYWGLVAGRSMNRIGGDPFKIARIDAVYLMTLPGHGRRSLQDILTRKAQRMVRAWRSPHGANRRAPLPTA